MSELCAARNSTPTEQVKAAGLAAGNVTYWRRGRIPNTKMMEKLEEYFGVEEGYFTAEGQKENQPTGFDGLTEDEIQLLTAYRAIAEPKKEVYLQIVTQGAEQSP